MEENKKELQSLLTRLGEIVPTLLFIGANADKQGALLIGSPEKTDEERKFDLVATVAMMMDQRAELREIILSAVSWVMQENEHHWISVKDRKPKLKHSDDNMKYSDTVIVTNGEYCTSARWLHHTWAGWYSWYDNGDEEVKDVTHWMPMPAPPKKGGQQ